MFNWLKKDNKDTNRLIEEKFEKLKTDTFLELASLKAENQSLRNDTATKQRVIDEQRAKLREQNEADILFMVKKIESEIIHGKTKEDITPHLVHLAALQQNQRNMAASSSWGGGIGNLMGKGFFQ